MKDDKLVADDNDVLDCEDAFERDSESELFLFCAHIADACFDLRCVKRLDVLRVDAISILFFGWQSKHLTENELIEMLEFITSKWSYKYHTVNGPNVEREDLFIVVSEFEDVVSEFSVKSIWFSILIKKVN